MYCIEYKTCFTYKSSLKFIEPPFANKDGLSTVPHSVLVAKTWLPRPGSEKVSHFD